MPTANEAYAVYQAELRTSLLSAMRERGRHADHRRLFMTLVPLWDLLSALLDDAVASNPTKELLLSYFSSSADLRSFLAVSADRKFERSFGKQLREASESVSFTSYFQEVLSDSLVLVNSQHLHNYRNCGIAMRCMLEDLYRHLYYKDNREDFLQVHEFGKAEHDINVSPKELRQYLRRASYLQELSRFNWSYRIGGRMVGGLFTINDALYGRLSAFVHGSSPRLLNHFASNLDNVFDPTRSSEVVELAEALVALSVSFLVAAHIDFYRRFGEETKRAVLAAFPVAHRQEFRKLFRV